MSDHQSSMPAGGIAPGDESDSFISGLKTYVLGLLLSLVLTGTSLWVVHSQALWTPGIPIGLCVLAVAQMGVHLVFFLHITTGPDNTNNILALFFGILIVFLVVAGSLVIMNDLNHNMLPMNMGAETHP